MIYPPAPEVWVRGTQLVADLVRWAMSARARGTRAPSSAGFDDALTADIMTAFGPGALRDRDAIVEEAERIAAGSTRIFGADVPLQPIDQTWHRDWITEETMPRGFQRWIRRPALHARGDLKRVWELNRHRWLIRLGQASSLTGEPRFAVAARALLASWIHANRPDHGVNWRDALEIGVRLIAWWAALPLFGPTVRQWPEWAEIMQAMDEQVRSIERHLSYFSSPNTHLLGEGLALFLAGLVLTGPPRAPGWRAQGQAILEAELRRQVGADGGHREKSAYYHCYALEMFLLAATAARCAGVPFDTEWNARVGRMAEVLGALIQPDGSLSHIGDDDGGRLLPLAAADYCRPRDLLDVATAILERDDLTGRSLSVWLDDMHVGTARTSWDAGAAWCSLQGAPLGMLSAGHSHAALGSVEISLAGRALIVDPGTFSYHAADWRDHFRRADAHNSIVIAGLEPFTPEGAFRMSDRGVARGIRGRTLPGVKVGLDLRYDLHGAGIVVEQQRQVLLVGPDRALVHDHIAPRTPAAHPLTWYWHLAADCHASASGPASFEIVSAGRPVARLRMDGPGIAGVVQRGWVSPSYGRKDPADVLVFRATTRLPATFVCEMTALV